MSVLTRIQEKFFKRFPYGNVYSQLRQSRESLEFALQSGGMGTWDIILKDNSISCSKEMLDLWGIHPENFKGQRAELQSKVHPDDLYRMNNAINGAIASDGLYELEYRIIPSPGTERWVLSRGRCTFEPGSKKPIRFSGVVFDITERKRTEEALRLANSTRDHFFTLAGHELKTPLTCLQLQLQVQEWNLANKYPEAFSQEKVRTSIKKQLQHVSRITRIVDHILDESRINEKRMSMNYEAFDLHEMIESVLEEFRINAEAHNINITFHSSGSILGMWDRFRLEQVLLNLLVNALRYGNKNPIQVELKQELNFAHLSVRDQGIGIKPEDQTRIFDRFERAAEKNQDRGMGLGLYISKNIVEAHKGEIRLKSLPEKGSEFTIVLPVESFLTRDSHS